MPMARMDRRSFLKLSAAASLAGLAAACGRSSGDGGSRTASGGSLALRVGYFANITHAQPQVARQTGAFARALGPNVTLDMSKVFNAGPGAMEALLAGAIDAAYVGPGPTLNAFAQTSGKALRIVAGATSGGASLVVRPAAAINAPSDFARKRIASPQLAGTQDVALRTWLRSNGLKAREDGGNVTVLPTANANLLTLFRKGDVDAAWLPEPWATRLVMEAGGTVFLDERSLWPGGRFVSTHLVVRTSYLSRHPDVIERLVRAHVETTDWIGANPAEARDLVSRNILSVNGAALPSGVVDSAWHNQEVTFDPIASSLKKDAGDACALGFLDRRPDLSNIYDLTALNKVLGERSSPLVEGL